MARGPYLRDELMPILDRYMSAEHSGRAYERFLRMKERHGIGSTRDLKGAAADRRVPTAP